jgi:hypothetical protein
MVKVVQLHDLELDRRPKAHATVTADLSGTCGDAPVHVLLLRAVRLPEASVIVRVMLNAERLRGNDSSTLSLSLSLSLLLQEIRRVPLIKCRLGMRNIYESGQEHMFFLELLSTVDDCNVPSESHTRGISIALMNE